MKQQSTSLTEDTGIILLSQSWGKGGVPALRAAMLCHQQGTAWSGWLHQSPSLWKLEEGDSGRTHALELISSLQISRSST